MKRVREKNCDRSWQSKGEVPATTGSRAVTKSSGLNDRPPRISQRGVPTLFAQSQNLGHSAPILAKPTVRATRGP